MSRLGGFFGGRAMSDMVTADELASQLRKQANAPVVLDVREAHEFKDAHILGATLIPLRELPRRLGELPPERRIVCVCRSGSRSGWATTLLRRNGFQAYNLHGGMIDWTRRGLPASTSGR